MGSFYFHCMTSDACLMVWMIDCVFIFRLIFLYLIQTHLVLGDIKRVVVISVLIFWKRRAIYDPFVWLDRTYKKTSPSFITEWPKLCRCVVKQHSIHPSTIHPSHSFFLSDKVNFYIFLQLKLSDIYIYKLWDTCNYNAQSVLISDI